MIDKDRIRLFRSFLPAGRQARSFHDGLHAFISGFLLFVLRAKKPLKYHILSSFLSLMTRHLLLVILLIIACHVSLVTSVYADIPKRIISLAPSMTEILFALGLGDNIVGVTNFCDYPEEAEEKQKIGGMSNPSLEAVIALKPDLVVMTTDGNPKEFEERLRAFKIKTYVFRARQLNELPGGVRELGAAMGVTERADRLAKDIEAAFLKLKNQDSRPKTQKKKVLFIIWPEPLIVAGPGTLLDNAIRLLGNENIASGAKTSYPKYSIEEIIHQSPDVIIIGRRMGQDIREVSQGLLKKITMVPAVKNEKVFYVSDRLYRLGPRVIKGIEELAGCLD